MTQPQKTLSFWQEILDGLPLDDEMTTADAEFFALDRHNSKFVNTRHLLGGTIMILAIMGLFG